MISKNQSIPLFLIMSVIIFGSIGNAFAMPNVQHVTSSTNGADIGPGSYVLIFLGVIVIGFFIVGIVRASMSANKEYFEKLDYIEQLIVEEKKITKDIPNYHEILDMNCIMCNNKIERPINMIKHLGIEQARKYLQFCSDNMIKPSLYCCKCYPLVEKNPDWQKAFDDMIDNQIKTNELRKLWENKIQV